MSTKVKQVSTCTPLVSTKDLLWYESTFWDKDFIKNTLIPHSGINENSKILIAGCGVGALSRLISIFLPTVDITGIELSDSAIEAGERINEELGLKNIKFIQGDILNLKEHVNGQKFDFVLDDGVLSYFPDKETELLALQELIDVTKPGGILGSFQLDFSSFLYGTDDFQLRNSYQKLKEALILAAFKNPDKSRRRNLIIAPQIPKMFWDKGLKNIKFSSYTQPEPLPPYEPMEIDYLDDKIASYTKGTKYYEQEYEKLILGGLTQEEIEKHTKVLKHYWEERKVIYDNEGFPDLQTQIFLFTTGKK